MVGAVVRTAVLVNDVSPLGDNQRVGIATAARPTCAEMAWSRMSVRRTEGAVVRTVVFVDAVSPVGESKGDGIGTAARTTVGTVAGEDAVAAFPRPAWAQV